MSISTRRVGLALALGTIAIALFVTQTPFEYRLTAHGVRFQWARIDWSWFPRTPRGAIRFDRDFALNLLMLVPLGVGFGLWRRGRGGALRLALEGLVLGALVSAGLELAQLATRDRYTSFADVWRNALGCGVGALLAVALSRRADSAR